MFSARINIDARTIELSYLEGGAIDPPRNVAGSFTDPAGDQYAFGFSTDSASFVDIPLDVNNQVLYGDYTFSFTDQGVTSVGSYYLTNRRDFNYPLEVDMTCLTAQVRITDNGDYDLGADVNRVFHLSRPAIATLDVAAREDSFRTLNNNFKSIAVGYAGVRYSFYLTGTVTAVSGSNNDIQITELFRTATKTQLLRCTQSLDHITGRVYSFVENKLQVAELSGVRLNEKDLSSCLLAVTLLSRLTSAVHLTQTREAHDIYDRIEEVVGFHPALANTDDVMRIGIDGAVGYPSDLPDNYVRGIGEGIEVSQDAAGRYQVKLSDSLLQLVPLIISRGGGNLDLATTPEEFQTYAVAADLLPVELELGDIGNPSDSSLVRARKLLIAGGKVELTARLELNNRLNRGTTLRLLSEPLPAAYRPRISSFFGVVFDAVGDQVGSVRVNPDGNIIVYGLKAPSTDGTPNLDPTISYDYSFSLSYYTND